MPPDDQNTPIPDSNPLTGSEPVEMPPEAQNTPVEGAIPGAVEDPNIVIHI